MRQVLVIISFFQTVCVAAESHSGEEQDVWTNERTNIGAIEYIEHNADGKDGVVLFMDNNQVFSVPAEALAESCDDLKIGECVEVKGISEDSEVSECSRIECS